MKPVGTAARKTGQSNDARREIVKARNGAILHIERLSYGRILELRALHVERERFNRRARHDIDDLAGKVLRLVIVVGRDPLQTHDVNVTGLELVYMTLRSGT